MTADFDLILQTTGEFGKYQKLVVWLLCVPTCFLNAYSGFGFVFEAYTPEFTCRTSGNSSENVTGLDPSRDQCFVEVSQNSNGTRTLEHCREFDYDQHYFRSTIITTWDLVCDRAIVWKAVMSYLNALAIAGCFLYSYMQDRWGRKKAFVVSILGYLVGNLSSLMAPGPWWFAGLRSPWTVSTISTWNIGYIWALEYVGPSRRVYVTSVMSVVYGVAAVSLVLLAYASNTWVQMSLMSTLPFTFLLTYYFIIDESPRWLLTQGRLDEAERTLKKMARWQGVTLKQDELQAMLVQVADDARQQQTSSVGLLDLFRSRNLRAKTLLITYSWLSVSVMYNSIAYNVENLGGNLYLTYAAQAAVEIPANALSMPCMNRFGRVSTLFFSILLSGLLSLAAIPADLVVGAWGVIITTSMAKFANCMSFCCIYLLAGELYPTVLRGLGTGFSSAVGDIGTIVMPYIVHSAVVYSMLPMIILGGLALLCAVGCLFLPETKDQHMPETIEEAEQHGIVGLKTFKKNLFKYNKMS